MRDRAGNSLNQAKNLRALDSKPVRVKEFLDSSDPTDLYRFKLKRSSSVSLRVSRIKRNADISFEVFSTNVKQSRLLKRIGNIDFHHLKPVQIKRSLNVLFKAQPQGNRKRSLTIPELDAGKYYIRVFHERGETSYRLKASATPLQNGGGSPSPSPGNPPKPSIPSTNVRINFQPQNAAQPAGYQKDWGAAYNAARGYGWVTPSGIGTNAVVPIDLTSDTRERDREGVDQRLDTLIHMQLGGKSAAWEYALPNGNYFVTVGAGDQPNYNSTNVVNVEGMRAINGFKGRSTKEYTQSTVFVRVDDGKLTVDSIGGTNTKLNFIEIRSANSGNRSEIELQNLDEVPYSDRLVFSRIGSATNPPPDGVHDVAVLRIKNAGNDPLDIKNMTLTGPWQFANGNARPQSIAPQSQVDIALRFVADSGDLRRGTLAIETNDNDESTKFVDLAGFWQSVPEGGQEPDLEEIVRLFGYSTNILNPGQLLNNGGKLEAIGEEVLSPYWRRLNSTLPVSVRQIASYHGRTTQTDIFWHNKGSEQTTLLATHDIADGQTILPRLKNSATLPTFATFSPSGLFGFKLDAEWSDPTKNKNATDEGHHVRFWPVRNREGQIVPGSWLMTMDYRGINYDYQDNVYIVENINPESA